VILHKGRVFTVTLAIPSCFLLPTW